MRVTFCTICLNEAEFIEANLRQHYGMCDRWIIVEGADRLWPADRAGSLGLSLDDTSERIRDYPDPDGKIQFIQHGWANDKSELRNVYASRLRDGDAAVIVDADEFLTAESWVWLKLSLSALESPGAVRIPILHFWKDRGHLITGGYFDMWHDRAYRWHGGTRYGDDHNHPISPAGVPLWAQSIIYLPRELDPMQAGGWSHRTPYWLHYGFSRSAGAIRDKNAYYVARGERETRPDTIRDRLAWFDERVPEGCELRRWLGPVPEVFHPEPEPCELD